jgi:hypothetical protein
MATASVLERREEPTDLGRARRALGPGEAAAHLAIGTAMTVTTQVATLAATRTRARATIPYPDAYAYVLALLTGQARLRETKALASTAILEAHKHGRTDSIVVFPAAPLTRGEAEVWMRAIGQTAA